MPGTPFKADLHELDEFERDLATDAASLERFFSEANKGIAEDVAQAAQAKAPKAGGALAGSIRASQSGTAATVEAGGGLEYGQVQEFGWPGHNIAGSHFVWGSVAAAKPEDKYKELLPDALRHAFPGM